jgi:hypothetical protein
LIERDGRRGAEIEGGDEIADRVPLFVEALHVWAERAAGHRGEVDAPTVTAGYHKRRPSTEVGEPHTGASWGRGCPMASRPTPSG